MIDERVAPDFWLSEFLDSETAEREGLDNTPGPVEMQNIRVTLALGAQRIRNTLGAAVFITSGYRSPEVNRRVRGSPTSAHMSGLAMDFKCPRFGTPRSVVKHRATSP